MTGPTAALWKSVKRAGWTWHNAHTMIDDLGTRWSALHDPPVAIMHAMRRTIRRLRFTAVAEMHPGLVPARTDIGAGTPSKDDVVISFANVLQPLATGRVATLTDTPEWSRKHASSLLSAVTGGQWPQARKAQVKRFNISDTKCQLCFQEEGTTEHRLACRFTKPAAGWSSIPEKAMLAYGRLNERRKHILRTTGLLAVKLPAPSRTAFDTFNWGSAPFDHSRSDVTWFIDGSMLNPKWRELSTLGFAIAAVGSNGDLLAWGWGTPPVWCDSASAAEAWALCVVLQISVVPPKVVTDCLGLVKTAAKGTNAASTSKMHLARVWKHIAHQLEGRIDTLVQDKMLVWMPAHQTASCIGCRLKSDHKAITSLDWRSNRLVDGLAKLAAADGAARPGAAALLDSAEALVRHSAAKLGVATHNANHYSEQYETDGGTIRTRTRRDAQQPVKKAKSSELRPLASLKDSTRAVAVADEDTSSLHSSTDSPSLTRVQRRRATRGAARKAQKLVELEALNGILGQPRQSISTDEAGLVRRHLRARVLLHAAGSAPGTLDEEPDEHAPLETPQSTAVTELLAADAAGTVAPAWNMLIALYELTKPFLFKPSLHEGDRVPLATRLPSPPLPSSSAGTGEEWGPFLVSELREPEHGRNEPPCGTSTGCYPPATQACSECPSSTSGPVPSELAGVDPCDSSLSQCVHGPPASHASCTLAVVSTLPCVPACIAVPPVSSVHAPPPSQERPPLEWRYPSATARPVRGYTRSSTRDLEQAISSLLTPSSTSSARASGVRSPGVGLQR